MQMRFWRQTVLFYIGGLAYMTLEFIWRGRSHGSMFLLGGLCFCVVGRLGKRLPPAMAQLAGAGVITALELVTGLLVNRGFVVWDYRTVPLNFLGQICLPFSLLWVPVSLAATVLYRRAERLVK
jgi:uncharacterized membrane protein